MMKFLDFFAGIGGFRRGLELAGHKCIGFCEYDKFATASYISMHCITDKQREYLSTLSKKQRQKEILKEEYLNGEWYADDIRGVCAGDLPEGAQMYCFGAPCLVAGTLITTDKGMIPIEDVKVGDKVLTHKERFRKVEKTMSHVHHGIYTLKVTGSPETMVTGNHRFYVRDKSLKWDNDKRCYVRKFSSPYWKAVADFTGNELIEFPSIKQNKSSKLSNEQIWLIGRYIADGYLLNYARKDRPSNVKRVVFCIGEKKINNFKNHIHEIKMGESKIAGSTCKFTTTNKELYELCSKCGRGAANKIIPQEIMQLRTDKLKIFLDGYLSGDGCCVDGLWKATSISQKLIYQLGECVFRAYKVPYRIYKKIPSETTIIEGRVVKQKTTWNLNFKTCYNKKQSSIIKDNILWMPVREISYDPDAIETVYNLEVQDDRSYTANNMGLHNCQDFSVAGHRAGLDGERSVLVREVFRLLEEQEEESRPEWLIYENVKGMFSSNRGLDYLSILSELDRLGYDCEWQNINSAWFVPQNRERIYTIGHLRRYGSAKILPIEGTDGENCVSIIGHRDSYRQNTQVFSPERTAESLHTCEGGDRGYTAAKQCFCDLQQRDGCIQVNSAENARALESRYQKGLPTRKAEYSGVIVPIETKEESE